MPNFRSSTIQLASGARLHYAEHGDPDGDPVVFLHGWPDSWFSFTRVVPLLPSHIHAFLPDQRGFGDSDRPDGSYRMDQFASDVVAFLDALSIGCASLVGHSFGSFVARQTAIAHPERVSRLVLIGTGLRTDTAVLREVKASMVGLEDPVPVEFAREFQASTAFLPLQESFFDGLVHESLKLPARLWRQVFDGILAYDDADQLGRIPAPTLLIWGDRDALFPREDQAGLLRGIRGARLEIYSETGHCPNWERPDRVASDIQRFFEQS